MPVIAAHLIKYYNHPSFRGGGTGYEPDLGRQATGKALCLLVLSIAFAAVAAMESGFGPAVRSFAERQGRQESWFDWREFGSGSHSKEWDAFMSFEE